MIAGEIYSTENVFNDSALAWYKKIANQLPFEHLDFTSSKQDIDEPLIISDEDLLPPDIDTLEDDDFTSHPDYLDTEEKSDPNEISFPAAGQPSGKSSINRIHLLIRQKRYYELSLFLNDLADDEQFGDRAEIEENVKSLLNKAKNLQREAEEYEHQGNPQKALEFFEKVAELVPDFPNLQENIERTQSSIELSTDDWASGETFAAQESETQEESTTTKKRVAFFEETTKASFKFLPLLGIIILLVLAVIFITPYFTSRSHLEKADRFYTECSNLISNGQFHKAQVECDAALATLKKISLYKKDARDALEKEIKKTLASEEMIQGLSGRVFFQGKYVRKIDMDRVLEFNAIKKEADLLLNSSKWQDASDKYQTALKTAQPILSSIEESLLTEIENSISVAEINLSIDRGFTLLSRTELDKSAEVFSTALVQAEQLPEELGSGLIARIEPKLHEIEYLRHLDLGKKFFYSNDWESAIAQYKKALTLQKTTAVDLESDEAKTLYANMAEAELFAFINNAKNAFSQSEWDEAIEMYQEAINLLDSKKDLLQRIDPKEIRLQLQRIILRTRIVQHKQLADQQLEKQQYSLAVASLENVTSAIKASGFADDTEFQAIATGTRQTIAETRGKAAIAQRIRYLEKNYKDIFAANYSAAIPEYLSSPKATFLRFEEGKELYEIQCIERNRGRQLRLVMLYSYDPAQNRWAFYSESN
jgi:tetratricopeptide (TPR) repeat protein